MATKRKKTGGISITLDGRSVIAMLSGVCALFVAIMPADSALWSAALGMQGIFTSYLGVRR
jgi:hypothetical protein